MNDLMPDELAIKYLMTEDDAVSVRQFTSNPALQKTIGELANRGFGVIKMMEAFKSESNFINVLDALGWDIGKAHHAASAVMRGSGLERSIEFAKNAPVYSTSIIDPTMPDPPTLSPL